MPVKKLSKAQLLAAKATLEANLAAHSEELKQNPQPGNQSVFHSLLALVGQLIVLAEDDYLAVNGDPAAEAVLALLCDSIELATKVKWNSYWSLLANSTTAKNLQTRSKQLIDKVLDDFLMQHLKGEHWDLCLKLLNFGLPEDKRIGTVEEKQIEVSLDEAIAACNEAQRILKEKGLAPSSQLHVIFAASLAQQCANRYAVATETAESLKKTVAKDTPEQVEYKRQRRVMLLSVFLQDGEPNLGLGNTVATSEDHPGELGDSQQDIPPAPVLVRVEEGVPTATPRTTEFSTTTTVADTTPVLSTTTTALTASLSAAEEDQADEAENVRRGVEQILTGLIEEEEQHLKLLTTMSSKLTQLTDDLKQRMDAAKRSVLVADKQRAVIQFLTGNASDQDVEKQLLALMHDDSVRVEAANMILQSLYEYWYRHESYTLTCYLYPQPSWQEDPKLLVGELMAYRAYPITCEAVAKGIGKKCTRINEEYHQKAHKTVVEPLEKQVEEIETVQAGIRAAITNANKHQAKLTEVKNDKGKIRSIVVELQQQKNQYVAGWFNAAIALFSADYRAISEGIRAVCDAAEAVVRAEEHSESVDVTPHVEDVLAAARKITLLEERLENRRQNTTSRFLVTSYIGSRATKALEAAAKPTTVVASLFQGREKIHIENQQYREAVESHRRAIASVA